MIWLAGSLVIIVLTAGLAPVAHFFAHHTNYMVKTVQQNQKQTIF